MQRITVGNARDNGRRNEKPWTKPGSVVKFHLNFFFYVRFFYVHVFYVLKFNYDVNGDTFCADQPLGPRTGSKVTLCPSSSVLKPVPLIAE